MNYIEFSKKIKDKYPEYSEIDDLELAKKIVAKYPEYEAEVTFDNINKGRTPLRVTPSGLIKEAATAPVAALVSAIENRGFDKEKFLDKREELIKQDLETRSAIGNINDFLIDLAAYSKIPMLKNAQGATKLAKAGTFAGNAVLQGGLPAALETYSRGGDVKSGATVGTGVAAALQGIVPPVVKGAGKGLEKVAEQAVKIAPFITKTLGRIKPETLAQVVKPNSKALDLNANQAQNLLMNTTEKVRKAYQQLIDKAGSKVEEAAKNLPKDKGIPANVLKDELDKIYGSYSTSGNEALNVAKDIANREYNDILTKIKSSKNNSYKAPTAEEIKKQFGIVEGYDKMPEPEFLKGKQDEAIQILSAATGKDPVWLKMNLLSDLSTADLAKRRELINKLVDESGDNLRNWYSGQQFQHYNLNNIDELGSGAELARKALDDVYNRNFYTEGLDDLGKAFYEYDINYKKALNDLIDQSKQGLTEEGIETFTTKADKGLESLPQDVRDVLIANTWDDLSKLEDLTNNQKIYDTFSVSAPEMHDLLKIIKEKTRWDDPKANTLNDILERVYGKYAGKLSKLSDDLKTANAEYSKLMDFEKNEGVRKILGNYGLDSSSQALKNYNSTVTKGNTNRNIQDLEQLLVDEGYTPFLNDIDDVNAAMDLLNIKTTGDSAKANMLTELIRPVLKLARKANAEGIPQKIRDAKANLPDIRRVVKGITPLAGKGAGALQGGITYTEDRY